MNRPRVVPRFAAFAIGLFALATPATAQTVITGLVVEAGSNRPIVNAGVAILDTAGAIVASTVTRPNGVFSLTAPFEGRFRLRAESLGYADHESETVAIGPRSSTNVRIELTVAPVLLEEVVIFGSRNRSGFDRRKDLSYGTRIDYNELLTRDSLSVSEFIAGKDPFLVHRSFEGLYAYNPRGFGLRCVPVLFVDGHVALNPHPTFHLEHVPGLQIETIRAVEVYANGTIPSAFFGGTGGGRACAVIAIWTTAGFAE